MILLTTRPTTKQKNEYGNSWKVATNIVKKTPVPALVDFCYCSYECEYFEYAFHSDKGWYENDTTSVIFNLVDPAGSFEVKINDILVTGDIATFNDYDTRKDVVINWKLVAQEHGNGDYKINVTINEFGTTIEKQSHAYRVTPYNLKQAERTIKIETVNTGVIKNGFDYRGLKWNQSIRVYGQVRTNPILETDEYQDEERRFQGIQTSVRDDFQLQLDYMPYSVYRQLWNNDLLSTVIKVSNYSIFDEQFRRKSLRISEFGEVEYKNHNRFAKQTITLKDQDLILKQFPQL